MHITGLRHNSKTLFVHVAKSGLLDAIAFRDFEQLVIVGSRRGRIPRLTAGRRRAERLALPPRSSSSSSAQGAPEVFERGRGRRGPGPAYCYRALDSRSGIDWRASGGRTPNEAMTARLVRTRLALGPFVPTLRRLTRAPSIKRKSVSARRSGCEAPAALHRFVRRSR